jgi:hypothetical protein
MKRRPFLLAIATAVIAAGAVALTASSASAQTISDRAQAPRNVAGVIFHPGGDCFEIWDNVKNGIRVRVSWNYHGIRDRVKAVYSVGRHSWRCVNMKEFPHQIRFRISGLDSSGRLQKSGILRFRTYGS